MFYPAEPDKLVTLVDGLLGAVKAPCSTPTDARLVALICAHAGYVHSGPIAATAHRLLRRSSFRRVVVMSPSHRVAFCGLALPDCDAFDTPIGRIPPTSTLAASM